jgi:hypothetical protein
MHAFKLSGGPFSVLHSVHQNVLRQRLLISLKLLALKPLPTRTKMLLAAHKCATSWSPSGSGHPSGVIAGGRSKANWHFADELSAVSFYSESNEGSKVIAVEAMQQLITIPQ